MQRKLLFLLLIVTALLCAFVGCKATTDSGGSNASPDENNHPTEGENNEAIYAPSTPFNIVFGDGCSEKLALNLQEAVYWENDVMAKVSSSNSATDTEHTIFIGRTGSELSDKAYELLDDMIEEVKSSSIDDPILVGYVYYVKGNSMAIAFSEDLYDSTVDVALDAFIEDYVRGNPTLVLKEGVQKKTYDYLEFLKKVDEKYYEGAWNKLSEELKNPELLEALKKLKKLYGSEVVTWIANLYDEEIGGFYYSNSGRNNQGFLPDVDSTYQALVLVGHTGMQSDFGYGSATWPAGLLERVGSFAKRLQDENGFFYHPNTHLVRDNYVADEFPWILSEDIAHGVHYNGVLGDIFANMSINDDADYEKLLALIETIPNGIIEKCGAICKDNPFPEYHMIKNSEDAWNLFFPTRNLSSSNFTDVDITDNKITINLSSSEWDYNVEILFEDTPKVSKSVLKNPMAKWSKLWFVFDNETVYLLNNENADTVDDIKPSTKYFCGNKVSYKITPYAPK